MANALCVSEIAQAQATDPDINLCLGPNILKAVKPPLKERVRNNLTWERGRLARAPGYSKMGKLFKTRSLMAVRVGIFFAKPICFWRLPKWHAQYPECNPKGLKEYLTRSGFQCRPGETRPPAAEEWLQGFSKVPCSFPLF